MEITFQKLALGCSLQTTLFLIIYDHITSLLCIILKRNKVYKSLLGLAKTND